MKRKYISIFGLFSTISVVASSTLLFASCKNNTNDKPWLNTELNGEKYLDLDLYSQQFNNYNSTFNKFSKQMAKDYSENWYKTLSKSEWNFGENSNIPLNLFCNSEQQALALYCCAWGDFWNVPLHEGKEPQNQFRKMEGQIYPGETLEIRGSDYKYISESLSRASLPENTVTYHGVEFMENEFYAQLELDKETNIDFSKCVGKTLKSYGFISTTIKKSHAVNWSVGLDWINNIEKPPLKEPFVFKIFIPKNISGAAYVSWLDLVNTENYENMILIDRNSKYQITNYYKEGDTNFFDMIYLGIEEN